MSFWFEKIYQSFLIYFSIYSYFFYIFPVPAKGRTMSFNAWSKCHWIRNEIFCIPIVPIFISFIIKIHFYSFLSFLAVPNRFQWCKSPSSLRFYCSYLVVFENTVTNRHFWCCFPCHSSFFYSCLISQESPGQEGSLCPQACSFRLHHLLHGKTTWGPKEEPWSLFRWTWQIAWQTLGWNGREGQSSLRQTICRQESGISQINFPLLIKNYCVIWKRKSTWQLDLRWYHFDW